MQKEEIVCTKNRWMTWFMWCMTWS